MSCELCGEELTGDIIPHWWNNGGTAEKRFIRERCRTIVRRILECQSEPEEEEEA